MRNTNEAETINNNVIRNLFVLLFLTVLFNVPAKAEDNDNQVVFPLNSFLTTTGNSPYPVVVQSSVTKLSSGSFVNVMKYGAKGNGLAEDGEAIAAAFKACKRGEGVLFPAGKTFLINNLVKISIEQNITVMAQGATFILGPHTGYNAIALECQGVGYKYDVNWIGGTFNGNKDQQSWPGSPTNSDKWTVTQGNYGLLTIRHARFALVKDVSLKNTVYDGIELYECKLGVIADSKAEGGAPLNYGEIRKDFKRGRQATYFKVTRIATQVAYFLNLNCVGGSIGVQYSTESIGDSSLAVVSNCQFYNQSQDAMHFEVCKKVFLYKCIVKAEKSEKYHQDVHISNSCEIASVKACEFSNAKIDFRNASRLKIGVVEDCNFTTDFTNDADTSVKFFVSNATHVIKCQFKGKTPEPQVSAKYISESAFEDFNVAVNGVSIAQKCSFKNGRNAIINPRNNPVITECTFNSLNKDLSYSVKTKKGKPKKLEVINSQADARGLSPINKELMQELNTTIVAVNQNNKVLGHISQ